jgi:RecJ-like exonuclease
MSKTKCIHCDGLGYFYNQSTFQSEHCPHCEGKGYIETVSHDLGGPVEVPVVEAPKAPKKVTKAPVVETPVVVEESVEESTAPIIETPTSGSDAK